MKARKVQNVQCNLTYPLQKRIYCGECRSTFWRKTCNAKTYRVCNRHNQNRDFCSISQIKEEEFHKAFARLYNKPLHNRRYILYPVLKQLRAIKERAELENEQALAIKKEIMELTERNLTLNRLQSKGYLNSALFIEQSNELNVKLAERRAAFHHALESGEYEDGIDEIERLIDIAEDNPDVLEQFDASFFGELVVRIVFEEYIGGLS